MLSFLALDYDVGTQHFTLLVEVTDDTTVIEIPVSVTVNPINEFTPDFGTTNADVTFAENTAIGTALVTHAATDDDADPHDIQRYEITAGKYSFFLLLSFINSYFIDTFVCLSPFLAYKVVINDNVLSLGQHQKAFKLVFLEIDLAERPCTLIMVNT